MIAKRVPVREAPSPSVISGWFALILSVVGAVLLAGWMFRGFDSFVLVVPILALVAAGVAQHLGARRWAWITAAAVSLVSVAAACIVALIWLS